MPGSNVPTKISEIRDGARRSRNDRVAVEEPLEIRLGYETVDGRQENSISIMMRTPGNDTELAVGFLFTESIIQKALMAGMPILAAVSAPSSLAVNLAREFNMTLVGFLRGETFNIYASEDRIA